MRRIPASRMRALQQRLMTDLAVTVDDASDLLHIDRKVAYTAVNDGKIPSLRVGRSIRIPTASLRKLLGIPAPK
jgi:excisionase family DNA binding protein